MTTKWTSKNSFAKTAPKPSAKSSIKPFTSNRWATVSTKASSPRIARCFRSGDNSIPIALTIAGSDPSGGAGIQADLKTFHQYGVYGTSVLTLLTVQNTTTVSDVNHLPAAFVLAQLDAVLEDLAPAAAKTGALGTREVIEAIAERAAK